MEALTRKVGPLPVWAWLGIVVVGYWAYRRYAAAQAAAASTTAAQNTLANAFGNITGSPYAGWQSGAVAPGQGTTGTSPGSGSGAPGTTPTPTPTATVTPGLPCTCPGGSSPDFPSTTDANGNCQCSGVGGTMPGSGVALTTGTGVPQNTFGSPGNTPGASVGGLDSSGQYVTAQTGVSYTQVPAGTPGAVQFTGSSTWYKAG